jgi:hypothetical protein
LNYLCSGFAVGFPVGAEAGTLVSTFFSSTFLSSFAGLEVGDEVDDGLDTAAGDETVTGVDVGVVAAGLLVTAGSHALAMAASAAKTVSRIDLLIVFPLFIDRRSVLSETAAIDA